MTKPRGLVCEQRECGRVRLREAEAGERHELVVDHVRGLVADVVRARARDEALAIRLERCMRALPAHRAPQPFRLTDREAGEMDGDVEHLILEDDDAERVPQRLSEQRVVRRRLVARVLAELLPPLDVRVHRLALDRPRPHKRDLDGDVVEISSAACAGSSASARGSRSGSSRRCPHAGSPRTRRDRRAGCARGRSAYRACARPGRRTPPPRRASPTRAGRSSESRRPRTSPCPTGTSGVPPSPPAAPGRAR